VRAGVLMRALFAIYLVVIVGVLALYLVIGLLGV
jgi:hypothetical protein